MKAKDILGSKEDEAEAKRPHGSGTAVSGYVEYETPKECRRCEYFEGKNLCNNRVVRRDSKVKTDKKSGLKIVQPKWGCCDHFEPKD